MKLNEERKKVLKYCEENNISKSTIPKYFVIFKKRIENGEILGDILELFKEIRKVSSKTGVTKQKLLLIYGQEDGLKRWNNYCDKQSYSNSQEYKGMSDEEFKAFNKSRAVSLVNLTKKYGEEIGEIKFKEYCERQSYTNSLEYFIEKYGKDGEQKWKDVNKQKGHTLENYIKKYGDEAENKLIEFFNKCGQFYSPISQHLFQSINEKLPLLQCYYAIKNMEFGIYSHTLKKYLKYDFVCTDLKICIEFNGDVFHANPKKFTEFDTPNPFKKDLLAKDIWEFDKIKNEEIINNGYDIIIIWESDFLKNSDEIIDGIYNYMKEKYEKFYC